MKNTIRLSFNRNIFASLSFIIFLLSACTKEALPIPPPVNPPYKSKLEVLWNTPISVDTAAYPSTAQSLVKEIGRAHV